MGERVNNSAVAHSWPGSQPTLDSVMVELRRIEERLLHHGETWKADAEFIRNLAEHNGNPAINPRPEMTPKLRSAFIRQAEAHLVFSAYCEKERQRLAEKSFHLENGTLDAEKDAQWRRDNERIAERAVEMEQGACVAQIVCDEPDLFTPTNERDM